MRPKPAAVHKHSATDSSNDTLHPPLPSNRATPSSLLSLKMPSYKQASIQVHTQNTRTIQTGQGRLLFNVS